MTVLPMPKPPTRSSRMLSVEDLQSLIGGDPLPTKDWIYRTVPHKIKMSHRCVRWWEEDVLTWMEGLRDDAA